MERYDYGAAWYFIVNSLSVHCLKIRFFMCWNAVWGLSFMFWVWGWLNEVVEIVLYIWVCVWIRIWIVLIIWFWKIVCFFSIRGFGLFWVIWGSRNPSGYKCVAMTCSEFSFFGSAICSGLSNNGLFFSVWFAGNLTIGAVLKFRSHLFCFI